MVFVKTYEKSIQDKYDKKQIIINKENKRIHSKGTFLIMRITTRKHNGASENNNKKI